MTIILKIPRKVNHSRTRPNRLKGHSFFFQRASQFSAIDSAVTMLETRGWSQTRSTRVSNDTRNRNLPRQIQTRIWNCPLVLYLATRQQVIPTTVHGPFKLLTRPITRVPTCPLTAVSIVYVYHVRIYVHARGHTRTYRDACTPAVLIRIIRAPPFPGIPSSPANLPPRTIDKVSPICRLSLLRPEQVTGGGSAARDFQNSPVYDGQSEYQRTRVQRFQNFAAAAEAVHALPGWGRAAKSRDFQETNLPRAINNADKLRFLFFFLFFGWGGGCLIETCIFVWRIFDRSDIRNVFYYEFSSNNRKEIERNVPFLVKARNAWNTKFFLSYNERGLTYHSTG